LYWQPGGNIDLVPETSYQLDFGQQIDFKWVNVKLNTYYINTKDFIQWTPNHTGLWQPENILEVESYGVELELKTYYNIGKHQFNLTGYYSYTVSENVDSKKQLIYVPYHKGNLNLAYAYNSFTMFYQHMFNGEVFTTEDNLTGGFYALRAYDVANLGCFYKVLNSNDHILQLGLNLNNIFNEVYQNVAFRPMPNRNFNIQIHYKF
jgi:iron complex outermembrane receptor protein